MFPKLQTVDISLLRKAAWNYKREDEVLQRKLTKNIERNGQLETIIVRSLNQEDLDKGPYEIVNGNHRLDSFKELKYTTLHVFNIGAVSDTAAYRIAIETNETRFDTNPLALSELLKEIEASIPALEFEELPFSTDEINTLYNLSVWDWDKEIRELTKLEEKASHPKVTKPVLSFTEKQLEIYNVFVDSLSEEESIEDWIISWILKENKKKEKVT